MPRYAAPLHRYAAPLRRWLRLRGFTVVATRPPEALEAVVSGDVDAGMAPLASIVSSRGGVRVCRNAPMVYTVGATLSSIVVSARPTRLEDCRAVAATWETRTSLAYLALAIEELGVRARLRRVRAYSWRALLSAAPCALVLGDEALRARAAGLHVVADIGELVWSLYRTPAVYAATVAGDRCPQGLRGPPWPKPVQRDALETARATGLSVEEAARYHEAVRLDYNTAALLNAFSLLRRASLPGDSLEPAEPVQQLP